MKGILSTFLIFYSINIFGCKCDTPTIESSFESADFVFIGDVYDVNKTYKTGYWNVENSLSKIKIEKIYKSLGDNFRSKEITFFGQQFNSCDIIFSEKGKYLIFAYIDPDTTFFYSSNCLATKSIKYLTDNDYKKLENLAIDYKKNILNNNEEQEFSLEVRTPDKIINELKFENKQLNETNQRQKKYFIIIGIALTLIALSILIYKKKKNCS